MQQRFPYRVDFYIDPAHSDLLEREGLDSFEGLMRQSAGVPVSFEPHGEVRRIVTRKGVYYLKRGWESMPLRWVVKKLLRGVTQHHRLVYEYRATRMLASNGFDVMKPVAWGERRILGFPAEGFLLTQEVEGTQGDLFWASATSALRTRLMERAGALIGAMHRQGIFSWIRLKDFFVGENPLTLTMIDLECVPERPAPFQSRRALRTLAKCLSHAVILRPEPTPRELLAFTHAYLAEVGEILCRSPGELFHGIAPHIRQLSARPGPYRGVIEHSVFLSRAIGVTIPSE